MCDAVDQMKHVGCSVLEIGSELEGSWMFLLENVGKGCSAARVETFSYQSADGVTDAYGSHSWLWMFRESN